LRPYSDASGTDPGVLERRSGRPFTAMTADDSLEPTVLGAGWRHRRVVGAWILAAIVLTGAYLVLRPTRYNGTASIVLQQGTVPGVNPTVTPDRFVADQVALLRSPVVAARARSVLNNGDKNVPAQSASKLGPVSVTSSATDSEVNISVGASTGPEADAEVRALLDAYSAVQNENQQAATASALQQINSTIAGVDAQLATLNPTGAAVPPVGVVNQVTTLQGERTQLQQQSDQIRVSNSLNAGRFIISSQPQASRQSILGTALKLGLVAVALGFLLGLGHAYLLGLRRKRFESKTQPHTLLRAPLLIDVPDLGHSTQGDQLVVRDAPTSAGAEAFAFAAQMQFGNGTGPSSGGVVVAVTSAINGAGTTTVVANLGLALARSGQLVLLIDGAVAPDAGTTRADHHEPSLTELFLGPGGAFLGLEDVTEGGVPLTDAAGTVDHRRLVLLGSGGRYGAGGDVVGLVGGEGQNLADLDTPNGSTDLSSPSGIQAATRRKIVPAPVSAPVVTSALAWPAVEQLLVEARELFDCILIDTPSVLSIGARAVLLQAADEVVLVIADGEAVTPVQDANGRIHSLGATVAGYVYNQMPVRGRGRSGPRSAR
jgi:Mrp family chromosome partitioning ATPase